MVFRSVGSAVEVLCPVSSTLVGSSHACAALVGSCHACSTLVGSCGGLLSRLLRPGGLLSCLLRPGRLLSRLLRPGGLLFRLRHPGGLLFRLLRLGALACRLCLSPQSLHFHMDLALRPSPCSTSAPPGLYKSVWKPLLGGGYVTNPVHAIPFTHHQRSLVHHIDSYTTLLLPFTIELHFPSSTALTQLFALITLTPENSHTITITQSHTLYKPWTSSCALPSIVCAYRCPS